MNNPTRKILRLLLPLIYIQFVLLYGFYYLSIKNEDLESFYMASRLVFEDNLSLYNFAEFVKVAGFITSP